MGRRSRKKRKLRRQQTWLERMVPQTRLLREAEREEERLQLIINAALARRAKGEKLQIPPEMRRGHGLVTGENLEFRGGLTTNPENRGNTMNALTRWSKLLLAVRKAQLRRLELEAEAAAIQR